MDEHVILVAVTVEAETRELAHKTVLDFFEDSPWQRWLDTWWIAEDDRTDGSDNDSAVFVTPGLKSDAYRYLHFAGMTASHNYPFYMNANDHSPDAIRFRERIELWNPEVPDDTVLDLLMRVAEDVSRDEGHDPEDVERLRAMFGEDNEEEEA